MFEVIILTVGSKDTHSHTTGWHSLYSIEELITNVTCPHDSDFLVSVACEKCFSYVSDEIVTLITIIGDTYLMNLVCITDSSFCLVSVRQCEYRLECTFNFFFSFAV